MSDRRPPASPRRRGGATVRCPSCGANTAVLKTRRGEGGQVFRLRRCLDKDHRFVTLEEPAPGRRLPS